MEGTYRPNPDKFNATITIKKMVKCKPPVGRVKVKVIYKPKN